MDILFVGPKPALFKGDGKGHFTEASALLGGVHGHFLGCAVGDYDNDGFPDLYLSGYREGRLLHNEGGKGFKDVTLAAGLKPQPWGTSCAFVQTIPGSGRLDLVIANYAHFGPEPGIRQLCDAKDLEGHPLQTSCGPRYYQPVKAALYRNQGGGRFTDESASSGFTSTNGRGLGVAACDYDGSGRLSIAFANDEIAGDLLANQGQGRFKNVGQESGVAYDRDSNVHGGMGTDWGDFNNDLKPDLLVATFQNEPKSLYRSESGGFLTDVSFPAGIGMLTRPFVAFGIHFLDFDNDGWLDIAIANGHVQDNIARIDRSTTYRQPSQLLHNKGTGTFEEVTAAAGAGFAQPIVGRGLAVGDYDNDGHLDLLIVDSEGAPLLLHNESGTKNAWLGITLVGSKSNRQGMGAQLTATLAGKSFLRHAHTDGSYLSSSDARVHFGLGGATKVDKLVIRWPSGQVDTLTDVPLGRYLTVREGQGLVL